MSIGLLLLWLSAGGCMIERGFIFFPKREVVQTPADEGVPFEDLYLSTPDGTVINAWFIPSPGSKKVLLWFHGNGGNLSHRVVQLRMLHDALGMNILMIDFRGYGRSEGVVGEEGTYQDALTSYDYLLTRPDIDPEAIVIYGQSLGAAVATELAVQRKEAGLILEAPFTSIRDMAKITFPWLPIGRLLSTRYDLLSKINRVQAPLLLIHGDEDEVVPYAQGRRVFEAARPPKEMYTVQGAGHNNLYRVGGLLYLRTIRRFVEAVSLNGRPPD